MDFPIEELLDPDACHMTLLHWLHPKGLVCPRCQSPDQLRVHRRHRTPVIDYRCDHCKRVFNLFTGTALQGSKRPVTQLVLILRGIAQGVPTAQLARELECDRSVLHYLRHRLQDLAFQNRDRMPLDDEVVEADEVYQNAGEKRGRSHRPERPATSPGQQTSGPRDVEQRPPADLRCGRSAKRSGAFESGASQ